MAKEVTVNYHCDNGCCTFTEECYLLEESDDLFVAGVDSEPYPLGTFGELEVQLGVIAAGLVMFEDEDGLFGLLPEKIISIRER